MDMPAALIFPLLLHIQFPLTSTRNFQSLDKGMLIWIVHGSSEFWKLMLRPSGNGVGKPLKSFSSLCRLHTFLFLERPVAEYLLVEWKIKKNDAFKRIRINWNIWNENFVFVTVIRVTVNIRILSSCYLSCHWIKNRDNSRQQLTLWSLFVLLCVTFTSPVELH